MMSVFIGLSISLVFWINLPVEKTMTLGGIMPTGFDEILGFQITKSTFFGLVILITLSIVTLFSLPIMGKQFNKGYEPIIKHHLSTLKFISVVSYLTNKYPSPTSLGAGEVSILMKVPWNWGPWQETHAPFVTVM